MYVLSNPECVGLVAHLVHEQVAQAVLAPQARHGVVLHAATVHPVATIGTECAGSELNLRQGAAAVACSAMRQGGQPWDGEGKFLP